MADFFQAVEESREIYTKEYLPELEASKRAKAASLAAVKEDSMNRLLKDLAIDRQNPEFSKRDTWDPDAEEDEVDDDEGEIIDRRESCILLKGGRTDISQETTGGLANMQR